MSEAEDTGRSLNMKMFNLVYAVGIIGILVLWNCIFVVMTVRYENNLPFVRMCSGNLAENSSISDKTVQPLFYIGVFLTISSIYAFLINKRTYKYLTSLNDNSLKNLPAKNILTFHDTKVLVLVNSLAFLLLLLNLLLAYLHIISVATMMNMNFLVHFIINDLLVSFVHPIIIILKTKKYLPQLWSDGENDIDNQNNDFFAMPVTDYVQSTEGEISVRKTNYQQKILTTFNENLAPSHPFEILGPEY